MNTLSRLLALALLAASPAAAQTTSRLAAEWHVPFRDAADAFALVDAASGTVRLATLDAAATVTWRAPVPTGLVEVTDATAGLPGASGEVMALASTSSNRVVLMDVETAAPFPRVLPGLSGIGPSGVAPVGPGPDHELIIASRSNGGTPGRLETRDDLSAGAGLLASSPHTAVFRRAQPLSEPSSTATLALTTSDLSGGDTRVDLGTRSGATHTLALKAFVNGALEFATNVRSGHDPTRVFAIGYRAGSAAAELVEFSTPLSPISSLTTNALSLPFAVATVIPVPTGGPGNLTDGFLAVAADGSQAVHFRINAAGNGIEPPSQNFPAAPGSFLNGLVPVPGIGIVKLGGDTLGGPSTIYHAYQWDGSAWVQTDAGTLPDLPAPGEIPATLLFYDQDPLADEAARLLGVRHVASWTRRTSADPVPANVLAENFASSASGLVSVGSEPVMAPPGTNYVMTTQFEPGISIAAAGDLSGLMSPGLRVDPPSGTYHETFQVNAEFDSARYSLRLRRDGGNWENAPPSIPVAWTTTLEFSLQSNLDGAYGPIITREYILPVGSIADIDSDNDGVPDYVELYLGLDPFGGADSDGDGVSDLDEILQGTDPNDPTSLPSPNLSAGVSPEGGISLVATATAAGGQEIDLGEDLSAHGLDGSLVARAEVDNLDNPLPDGGTRGAVLQASTPQALDSLIAVRTPVYFDISGGARVGREIIAFFPATAPPPFEPAFTPSGTSLAADALGWIAAAQIAAANRPPALARSIAEPADAAVSVLLEEMVHAALDDVRPPGNPPPPLADFSFLPGRVAELRRYFPDEDDRALLAAAGFDFPAALDLATSARASMAAAANGIYQHHAANSETSPGIAMPIDALRKVLRGGTPTATYSGAVGPGDLATAQTSYATALSLLSQAFRPMATWTVEIPASPPDPGVYLRVSDTTEVALLNDDGSRFLLERGLGLQPGTRFTVTGFIDTPSAGPYPTMEIIAAALVSRPAASDNDQDGNLLDDEWELFFFGATGQDPFSEPHGGGYTLLQYFLDGTDPRGGSLPAGPPVNLVPQLPVFTPDGSGGYTLDFLFPAAYQGQFTFIVERSLTLDAGSWVEIPGIPVVSIGGDELRATIPPAAAPPGNAFYRIRVALAP